GLLMPLPADVHPLEDLAGLDVRRPVDDEAEAPRFLVMKEEHDAAMEGGIEHLGHGQQQDRGGEIGAGNRHGENLTPGSGSVCLWIRTDLPSAASPPGPLSRTGEGKQEKKDVASCCFPLSGHGEGARG